MADNTTLSVMVLTYNRDVLPCLEAIKNHTNNKHNVILVDNGNSYRPEYKDLVDTYIGLKGNEGVIARNYGKLVCTSEFIACIDDDVIVFPGWDEILMDAIESDDQVAGAGPCGAYVFKDLSNYNEVMGTPGSYVDVLTGYCWMHRHIPEGLLPWGYDEWKFWHEETYIQFQMREEGYRFKMTPNVCYHDSQRGGTIDWESHNDKIERIKERFDVNDLNLEKR
jgi:glycosyltransferase involved in cell wall biosynthesis